MFIGNLFVYFQFQGLDKIDRATRSLVIWVLCGIGVAGTSVALCLPKPKLDETVVSPTENRGPVQALKDAGKLFVTRNMLFLSITFFYTGKYGCDFTKSQIRNLIVFSQELNYPSTAEFTVLV